MQGSGVLRRAGRHDLGGPPQAALLDRDAPMVVKRLEEAGLPHRRMHEARHTAITNFLRRTGNLKLAQMLAGHADIGTTANIYAHLDTSDLETALRALNEEQS